MRTVEKKEFIQLRKQTTPLSTGIKTKAFACSAAAAESGKNI